MKILLADVHRNFSSWLVLLSVLFNRLLSSTERDDIEITHDALLGLKKIDFDEISLTFGRQTEGPIIRLVDIKTVGGFFAAIECCFNKYENIEFRIESKYKYTRVLYNTDVLCSISVYRGFWRSLRGKVRVQLRAQSDRYDIFLTRDELIAAQAEFNARVAHSRLSLTTN